MVKNKKGELEIIIPIILAVIVLSVLGLGVLSTKSMENNFCKEKFGEENRLHKYTLFGISYYECCEGKYDKVCNMVNKTKLEEYMNSNSDYEKELLKNRKLMCIMMNGDLKNDTYTCVTNKNTTCKLYNDKIGRASIESCD